MPSKPRTFATLALATLLALPTHALSQSIPRSQVQLASDAAVRGLKEQVDRLPLGPNLTVGQYLTTVKGDDFMIATLQRAQLIGGPRPLDANTVQVRLDITGRLIADALAQIAAVRVRFAPVPTRFVVEQSRAWSDRTFTATATSSGTILGSGTFDPRRPQLPPQSVPQATALPQQPLPATPPTPASPTAPPEAIAAAQRSVAAAVITRVSETPLPLDRKGSDFVSLPGVADALTTQILSRPYRDVQVLPAGEVRVTVLLDRAAFFETLKTAASVSGSPKIPPDDAGWSAFREPILAVIPESLEGIAKPASPPPTTPSPSATPNTQPNELPPPNPADRGPTLIFPTDRPPAWTADSIDALGVSPFAGSKLLTARAAGEQAQQRLYKQLESLELAKGLTLAEAARRDPRFAQPLLAAVQRSRVFNVEYLEDGSAAVQLSTDTRELWQDLLRLAN